MSDLHCAATLLIARHGEADHEPASGGSLSVAGRAQARGLAKDLRERNLAMVYCSSMAPAVQTAEIVAAELGVMVRVRDDLPRELEAAADLHRGETVLFVSHDRGFFAAVPQLAGKLPADYPEGRALGSGDLVEVAADADGWVVRSRADESG